jgi:sugar lactone lactonase YvrE
MNNTIRFMLSTFALVALAFYPARALADTLYEAGTYNLSRFNTAVGASSQSTIPGASSLEIVAMTVDSHGNVFLAAYESVWDPGLGYFTAVPALFELGTNGVLQTVTTNVDISDGSCLAVDSHGNLFEGEWDGINEFVNTAGTLSSTPVVFGGGVQYVHSLAFDSGGNLFVASWDGTYEFTNNAGPLSINATVLFDDYPDFGSLAFDSSGDLFLSDGSSIYESINTAGTLSSFLTVVSENVAGGELAFDSSDNLFASDNTGDILEFSNNGGILSSTPTTFVSGLSYFVGMAFQPTLLPAKLCVAGDRSIFSFNPVAGVGSRQTVASGLSYEPAGMATDSQGNLFESDGAGTIYEIPRNGVPAVFVSGLDKPEGLAFDASGNLFEADNGSGNIYEFTNNAGILSTNPTLFANMSADDYGSDPVALAFDGNGDLWAAGEGGLWVIVEFVNTGGTLSATPVYPLSAQGWLTDLAFDGNGNLYVSGEMWIGTGYSGGVFEFVYNNSVPQNNGGGLSSTPVAFSTSSDNIASIAFDSNGNLYEVDGNNGNVDEFSNNAGTLSSTPTTFVNGLGATGVAMNAGVPAPVAPPVRLYAGGYQSGNNDVYMFNPAAGSGSQSDIDYVFGYNPTAMAVDSRGNVFEFGWDEENDCGAIYEFPWNGVPGIFVTGLNEPEGLAIDANGDLFASDQSGSIYKFTNNGGVLSTIATVFSAGNGLMSALAFDSYGNLFAADSGSGSIAEFVNTGGALSSTPSYPFGWGQFVNSLAFDGNGNLFVSGEVLTGTGYNSGILEYQNNNSAWWYNGGVLSSTPIIISSDNAAGLVCDASNNLYEVNGEDENIYEFVNKVGTLSSTPKLYANGLDVTCLAITPHVPTNYPPNLYVADSASGIIYGFNTTNGAASQVIVANVGAFDLYNSDPFTGIPSLAFDYQGNLFMSVTPRIYELTNNAGTLSSNATLLTINDVEPLSCLAGGLVFDAYGNLYMGEIGVNANFDNIERFTNSDSGGLGVWSGGPYFTDALNAYSLAFDAWGNLFAADYGWNGGGGWGGYVIDCGNPASYPQTLWLTFDSAYDVATRGMAFDRMGNLFVGQIPVDNAGIYTGGPCYINEFTNSFAGLSTNATVFASGLGNIGSLVFDASGNLFETEEDSGKLNEFINAGGTLSSTPVTFATGLGAAAGMAIYFSPVVRGDWYISTAGGTPQINIANMSLSTPASPSLVISWSSTATANGYVVQTNGDLTTTNWGNYGGTMTSNQGTNSVSITPGAGNLFFRLCQP